MVAISRLSEISRTNACSIGAKDIEVYWLGVGLRWKGLA